MQDSSGVSRRGLLRSAGVISAMAAGKTMSFAANSKTPPNVIFVLMDDVGYGDLACHGNRFIHTPNIDNLHQKSIRFTNFHVSPTCAPTRASLMTGRYCNATGVWHTIMGRSLLDPREQTLAECFRASGYRTGIFGKWHLGDNYPCRPQDKGFDEVAVCGGGGVWQTPDYFGNDYTNDMYFHNGKPQKANGFCTDAWFDLAFHFMQDSQGEQKPFFCYLPTNAAHEPYWALPEDSAPYGNVPGLRNSGFYGMIANIDKNMGRLAQFLDRSGLAENTILLFSSDNGTAEGKDVYNASMRGAKGSPYEGGHRVPLFLHWPAGGLVGGRDVAALTAHIDLLPTLADLCNLKERGRSVHGRSWKPLLQNNGAIWKERTIVIDSQREENLAPWRNTCVMTEQWRLVNAAAAANQKNLELYDIQKDPGQKSDVAGQFPAMVQKLIADYEKWWKQTAVRSEEYVRIVLGSERENPAYLNCMDWHGADAIKVWNQRQIRTAPIANGFWTVHIQQAGNYRFELRRWPKELDLPINAPYVDQNPNREKTPGIAIEAIRARLTIGSVDQSQTVRSNDKAAQFTVTLPRGPAQLRTWFYNSDGTSRGAYYVGVERLP
jgi:arylsulfatase A-like enzyme